MDGRTAQGGGLSRPLQALRPAWVRVSRVAARPAAIAVALTVLGVLLRMYRLDGALGDEHAYRQTQTAAQVLLYDRFGFDWFDYRVPMFGGGYWLLEFPFYQWVVYALTQVFGHLEVMGRLVSIASYAGSSALLYAITRRLTGRRAAAVGAVFFLALVPLTVFYGRAFMIDQFLIMTALLVVYGALRMHERWAWRWFALTAAALFVTTLGKANLVVVLCAPAAVIGVRLLLDRRVPRAGKAALVAAPLVTAVCWRLWLSHTDEVNAVWNGMTLAVMRDWYLGSTFTDTELWRTLLQRILDQLSVVGVLVVVLGLLSIPRVRTPYRPELVALVAVAALSLGVFANLNRIHDYYQLPLFVVLALLGGIGLSAIRDGVARVTGDGGTRVAAAVGVTLGVIWWTTLMGGYFGPQAVNLGWRAQGAEIRAATPDRRLLIVQENADPNEPNLWYEARRIGWRVKWEDEASGRRWAAQAPDLGAIVVLLGPAGIPPWVERLAAERGFTKVHRSPGTVVYRVPGA